MLLLASFQFAIAYSTAANARASQYASAQLHAASVIHLADYLVKYGAACSTSGINARVSHHCFDAISFAQFSSTISLRAGEFGFSQMLSSDAPPAISNPSQFCASRKFYDSVGMKTIFICGWQS